MNEQSARMKANYHLTYGGLIKALENAPVDAVFDKRIKGIGSYRGSYIEIALFTDTSGFYAVKEEFNGDYKQYEQWEKNNAVFSKELPKNANELGKTLKSLLGLQFIGYKGGNFTIEEWKPLWFEKDDSSCNEKAILGITKNLKLITKKEEKE